jgi:hypothetical protein
MPADRQSIRPKAASAGSTRRRDAGACRFTCRAMQVLPPTGRCECRHGARALCHLERPHEPQLRSTARSAGRCGTDRSRRRRCQAGRWRPTGHLLLCRRGHLVPRGRASPVLRGPAGRTGAGAGGRAFEFERGPGARPGPGRGPPCRAERVAHRVRRCARGPMNAGAARHSGSSANERQPSGCGVSAAPRWC